MVSATGGRRIYLSQELAKEDQSPIVSATIKLFPFLTLVTIVDNQDARLLEFEGFQ